MLFSENIVFRFLQMFKKRFLTDHRMYRTFFVISVNYLECWINSVNYLVCFQFLEKILFKLDMKTLLIRDNQTFLMFSVIEKSADGIIIPYTF